MARKEIETNSTNQVIRRANPVIFQVARGIILPVTRECIESFSFTFEEFRIVSTRGNLHIVTGSKTVDGMNSERCLDVVPNMWLEHEAEMIAKANFGSSVSVRIEGARNPISATINVILEAEIVCFHD